jgi:hypothetical protein
VAEAVVGVEGRYAPWLPTCFMATDTSWAPWFIVRSDDKRRARLNILEHLLATVPYKKVPRSDVRLPKREVRTGTFRPQLKVIPEVHQGTRDEL